MLRMLHEIPEDFQWAFDFRRLHATWTRHGSHFRGRLRLAPDPSRELDAILAQLGCDLSARPDMELAIENSFRNYRDLDPLFARMRTRARDDDAKRLAQLITALENALRVTPILKGATNDKSRHAQGRSTVRRGGDCGLYRLLSAAGVPPSWARPFAGRKLGGTWISSKRALDRYFDLNAPRKGQPPFPKN
jgi:hypothetical protein